MVILNMMHKSISARLTKIIFPFLLYFSVVLFLGFVLIPFYNMLLISITPENVYLKETFLLFPKEITFDSFKIVFNNTEIWKGLFISTIITTVGTLYNLFLSTTAAYVLTQKFPHKKFFVILIFLALFFDGGLISNYLLISNLGLIDSVFAMILPSGINITYLLLLYKAFSKTPSSMIESAKLDGSSDIKTLFKIVIPSSRPVLSAVALYYAVERWNEWYLGMLYINTSSLRPLQLVLKSLISNANAIADSDTINNLGVTPFPTGIQMAATLITMIPIIIIFPFLQKHFISVDRNKIKTK